MIVSVCQEPEFNGAKKPESNSSYLKSKISELQLQIYFGFQIRRVDYLGYADSVIQEKKIVCSKKIWHHQ